ncbi:hypothetical protein [Paenibacillus sp. RC21]|uniref:hypothetical protein n=1 Tax=Paenibacillus sp. RC21 TaxID=3156312 RepID=UPI0038369EFC
MISDIVLQLVDHYGYLFFFLAFCLGPFGVPVPNEITILTGGILSNNGALNPWIVYMLFSLAYLQQLQLLILRAESLEKNLN